MELGKNFVGRRGARAGIALVTVLVTLTALLVLVAVFGQHTTRASRESLASVDDRRAFYLAESALSEAMTAVRAGQPGIVASQATPAYLGGGVLWVTAEPIDAERTRLVATAMCGGGRAALEAIVRMKPNEPLFQAVLNSDEPLTLNSGVQIDSFDSELGDYAAQVVNNYNGVPYANDEGDVASNHAIICNANAMAFGDATPGPGYSVSFATGSYVSGSTTPALVPFAFDPIAIPNVASTGAYTVPANTSQTLGPGFHGFDGFTIGQAGTVTITGPASVVCTNFLGGKNGKVQVDATNGPVTFYVQGTYSHMQGFQSVAVPGSELAVAYMISQPQSISFPASSIVRGAFYAPDCNITFTSNNQVFGAIAANRIDMSSGTKFHYDESLMDHWQHAGEGAADPLDQLAWREAKVTPDALLRDRRDPFVVLGVDREALPSPAEAWGAP